jgi:hypothetical protein
LQAEQVTLSVVEAGEVVVAGDLASEHVEQARKMSSTDLQVVVQDVPADPVKPAAAAKTGKLAGAAAAGKQLLSTPKGKALAGLGVLCVLLPAIIVPAAVASQKNKQSSTQLANSQSRGINSQTGSDIDSSSFVGADGGLVTSNTTLKVPTRTLNKTKDAVAAKTFEKETWTPFVKIANGQVRPAAAARHTLLFPANTAAAVQGA